MRWIKRPSICACRCSPGHIFGRPSPPLRCTRCLICVATIPSFIHISDGKLHDVHALDMLIPEPGAIYVMDRGYIDFGRLHTLHQAGAFFVTRAKSNLDAHRIYSSPTDRTTGVIADQT